MTSTVLIAIIGVACLLIFSITSTVQLLIIKKSKPSKFKCWTGYGRIELEYNEDARK